MKACSKSSAVMVCVAASLVMAACSKSPSARNNDARIAESIQSQLDRNPQWKPLAITVASKNGIVTLKGTVQAGYQKLAIEDLADKTQGVLRVQDQLQVAPQPAAAQAANAPLVVPRAQSRSEALNAPPQSHRQSSHTASERSSSVANENQSTRAVAENSPPPETQPQPASSSQPASSAPTEAPPPPPPVSVTIPRDSVIRVRMIDSISSETARLGQTYAASILAPVVVQNKMVVPQGAYARVRVVGVDSAGHLGGQPELRVELVGFTAHHESYDVRTDPYEKIGKSRAKTTAERVGGGAGLGALLGAVIGRGKGAAIGAAIGGAAGTASAEANHGEPVTIPSEATINFVLRAPVTVTWNSGE